MFIIPVDDALGDGVVGNIGWNGVAEVWNQ